MTYIILLRHGESEANVANDNSDVPTTKLTKRGHEQAKRAAEYIASLKFLNIKHVLSSPFTRALDTATHVAKKLKLKVTVVDGLREASSGIIDGVKFGDVKHLTHTVTTKSASGAIIKKVIPVGAKLVELDAKLDALAKSGMSQADPAWKALIDKFIEISGGETEVDIYRRISKVVKEYANAGSILIVSHGGTIREYISGRFNINRATIGTNYGKDKNGKDITNCHLSIINTKTKKLEMMFNTKYLTI